jgi:hypothetical protein
MRDAHLVLWPSRIRCRIHTCTTVPNLLNTSFSFSGASQSPRLSSGSPLSQPSQPSGAWCHMYRMRWTQVGGRVKCYIVRGGGGGKGVPTTKKML